MSRRPNWSPTASILFSRTAHLPARVVHPGTSHVSLEGMGVDLRRGPGLTARETSSSAAAGFEILPARASTDSPARRNAECRTMRRSPRARFKQFTYHVNRRRRRFLARLKSPDALLYRARVPFGPFGPFGPTVRIVRSVRSVRSTGSTGRFARSFVSSVDLGLRARRERPPPRRPREHAREREREVRGGAPHPPPPAAPPRPRRVREGPRRRLKRRRLPRRRLRRLDGGDEIEPPRGAA